MRDKFEIITQKLGFRIVKRLSQIAPDYVIEKEDKTIGIELKTGTDTSSLEKALGQLLFAKKTYNLQELWLVLPPQIQPFPGNWLDILKSQGIKILILEDEKLTEVS